MRRSVSPVAQEYLCVANATQYPWLLRRLWGSFLSFDGVDWFIRRLAEEFGLKMPEIRWTEKSSSAAWGDWRIDFGRRPYQTRWHKRQILIGTLVHEFAHLVTHAWVKKHKGKLAGRGFLGQHGPIFTKFLDEVVLVAAKILP